MTDTEALENAEGMMRWLAEGIMSSSAKANETGSDLAISELQAKSYTNCADIVRDYRMHRRLN